MKPLLVILAFVTLATLSARAQHPVLPDLSADPSAREFNGKYYIYPTHDVAGSKFWSASDWHVYSSSDLVAWKDEGVILSLKDLTWAKKWAWAPDCIERNGQFYLYFAADEQVGVAVSDSPTGPFKDPLGKPLIARKEAGSYAIDPNIFIEDDGQAYLYFGGGGKLKVVKLKEDMITRDGDIISLDAPKYTEGIWVFKRNGTYYFTYPVDGADPHKNNLMAYSISHSPVGPFEYKGAFLDNRSRNIHGSIAQFGSQWYVFYHIQGASPYERKVCIEYLDFNSDGTIKPVEMTRAGVVLKK